MREVKLAITSTATYTATFTRKDLIILQVTTVLGRAPLEARDIAAVEEGLRKQWIGEISLYGINHQGHCVAELYIKIDWQQNSYHLVAGRDTVIVGPSWRDGVSVEVEKTKKLFFDLVSAEALNIEWCVRYLKGVDVNRANRELGFVPAEPVTWISGSIGTAMVIPELDEFTIGIKLRDR